MSVRSHRFNGFNQYSWEFMCLVQENKTLSPVAIEPRTSRFGVRCSITTPDIFAVLLIFADFTYSSYQLHVIFEEDIFNGLIRILNKKKKKKKKHNNYIPLNFEKTMLQSEIVAFSTSTGDIRLLNARNGF